MNEKGRSSDFQLDDGVFESWPDLDRRLGTVSCWRTSTRSDERSKPAHDIRLQMEQIWSDRLLGVQPERDSNSKATATEWIGALD